MAQTAVQAKHTKWDNIEVEPLSPLIGRQMVVGTNVMVARVLLKKGAKPLPEQAIAEAQLTTEALRNGQ